MTGTRLHPPPGPAAASAAGEGRVPRSRPSPPLRSAPAFVAPVLAGHGHALWTEWGALEWAIVAVGGAISLWVIWLAVRHTFRPGEQAADHVKRSILEDEDRALDPPHPLPQQPTPPAPPTARR